MLKTKNEKSLKLNEDKAFLLLRGQESNLRPLGYEANEGKQSQLFFKRDEDNVGSRNNRNTFLPLYISSRLFDLLIKSEVVKQPLESSTFVPSGSTIKNHRRLYFNEIRSSMVLV